jgi:uncharacterized protein (TIGR03437 family)
MKNFPLAAALLIAVLDSAAAQGPNLRVVNGGSLLAGDFSPGTIISITGSNLTSSTASAPDQLHPFTVLNGVSVKIAGVPAGLLYVSPMFISALIDPATPTGPAALVLSSPSMTASASVNIQPVAAPGVIAWSSSGGRDGLILNAASYTAAPFTVTTGGAPTDLLVWTTGLDLTTAPAVTIGGLPVTVQSSMAAACCVGLEQITVELPPALAGAGRAEVVVTSGGKASNAVETVLLPGVGQGPFPPAAENTARNREIGAIAFVPAVGQALVLDESDDVVRVVDMKQRAVVRTIALASGSQPFAIAANDAGTQAVVAERGRARAAFIDLARDVVITEVPVDPGPSAVAINGDVVLVASEDNDTVSVISLVLKQVRAVVPVGRSPRSIAIDDTSFLAYVANENGGNITVIDLGKLAVVDTIALAANARPVAVRLIPQTAQIAVAEPNLGTIEFIDLVFKRGFSTRAVANDFVVTEGTEYLANQTAGTVTATPVLFVPAGALPDSTATINVDAGLRSLAIDTPDHLLLVSSESSGAISLLDLSSNRVVGTINAVRGESESAARRDRSDHDAAANIPVITSITPKQTAAGSAVQLVVNGTNLAGTFDVFFAGAGGRDAAFQMTGFTVDSTGQQLIATVQVASGAAKGDHVLRVFTPNGESGPAAAAGNVLTVF